MSTHSRLRTPEGNGKNSLALRFARFLKRVVSDLNVVCDALDREVPKLLATLLRFVLIAGAFVAATRLLR